MNELTEEFIRDYCLYLKNVVGLAQSSIWIYSIPLKHIVTVAHYNGKSEYPSTKTAFSFGETFHVTLSDGNKADSDPAASRTAFSSNVTTQVLVNYLSHRGHHNVSVAPIEASIEDCFMALMK